jgi:hypothetical protein
VNFDPTYDGRSATNCVLGEERLKEHHMGRCLFGSFVLLATGFAAAAEPELHVVALSEPSFDAKTRSPFGARVSVDRPGEEVVLLVCGASRIEWEITATPKTKVTKVLFVGRERQGGTLRVGVDTVEVLPADPKQRVVTPLYATDYHMNTARFRQFVEDCKKHTGLEIASFQAARRFDHSKPFVVDAVQTDERLSSDFPKVAPAEQVAKFQAEATRVGYGQEYRNGRRTYGTFTQAGPTAGGFVQLPDGIRRLVFDTKAKRHYGTDGRNLYGVDLKLGTAKKIDRPTEKAPGFGVLAYDAKRERVVVNAGTAIFEYATAGGGKWKQLAGRNQTGSYAALAWHAKSDTLFAFGVERHKDQDEALVPTLYELNADGTLALANPLGPPLCPSILGGYGTDVQLLDLGRDLGLLVQRDQRDGNGRHLRSEAFLYVINPKSGKVQLAWKQ